MMNFPFGKRRPTGRDATKHLNVLESSLTGLSLSTADSNDFDDENEDDRRTGPLGLNQLNVPLEPLIDIVFVHGVGGGSRKSWSKSASDDHYWPQAWLPRDLDFQHVRIHAFGYTSAKSEVVTTIAAIPDIANSLLIAMRDASALRSSNNPLILIGHSMGGLVIKKAFVHAHNTELYKDLASRLKALYFIGTPHRGSGLTQNFQRLFKRTPLISATENITDLDPTSRLLESLNNDFPQVSHDIEIRTYWEAQQCRIVTSYHWVVHKSSACLNYTNEITDSLDADHRGMVKFSRPTDPNFVKLRNALAATVDNIIGKIFTKSQKQNLEVLQSLQDYLSVRDKPEVDLMDHEEMCLRKDSCEWFTKSRRFRTWRDGATIIPQATEDDARVSLLEADPGAGKSVLAGQVVDNLSSLNLECSYYFFDEDDREKSTAGGLLRSIAYQMALLSPNVRQALMNMKKEGVQIQTNDDRLLWKKLFVQCILTCNFPLTQYWVIDGLDECSNVRQLTHMIARIEMYVPLKIFLTSRPDTETATELQTAIGACSRIRLSKDDTVSSIKDYVVTRTSNVRVKSDSERETMINMIVEGAAGCYLWAKLVLDNISKAVGPKQITQAIQSVPKGMDSLYNDIMGYLEEDIEEEQKPIFKTVLDWVCCCNPHLTSNELEAAIALETESTIYADRMCDLSDSLIYIDKGQHVRFVHPTARQYLLKQDLTSQFAVDAHTAHLHIAKTLLKQLQASLRPIRNGAQLAYWQQANKGLNKYALLYFSTHVRRAPTDDHEILLELDRLVSNHGMTWIACVAATASLNIIIKTSQNIRHWLQARGKNTPPIGDFAQKSQRLQQWTTDLMRLVAKFGRHLLSWPGSTWTLISPLVPAQSVFAVKKPRPRDISVVGMTQNEEWDDRLCSLFYERGVTTAVASGKDNFGIGLQSGEVFVYDHITLQIVTTFNHGGPVKLLKYNEPGNLLLCSGFRRIGMWSIPAGARLWSLPIKKLRLAAEFVDNCEFLLTITPQNEQIRHNASTGEIIHALRRTSSVSAEDEQQPTMFRRELQYAEYSAEAEMVATMQRERPIQLSDIHDRFHVAPVEMLNDDGDEEVQQPITTMTFCANLEIALLAVSYREGSLAVFDRDVHLIVKRADYTKPSLLAGSPDGRILAAANTEGVIMLHDFETLAPLHMLNTSSIEHIRALTFSSDGHRLFDIRGRQCNVWEPPALVNTVAEDLDSFSDSTLQPTFANSDLRDLNEVAVEISSIEPIPQTDHLLCGLGHGQVVLYSTKDGKRKRSLCHHSSKQWISRMSFNSQARILALISGTAAAAIYQIASDFSSASQLAAMSFSQPIKQLLANNSQKDPHVFIATLHTITIWGYKSHKVDPTQAFDKLIEKDFHNMDGLWIGEDGARLIYAEPECLTYYSWDDLSQVGRLDVSFPGPGLPNDEASTVLDDEDFEVDEILEIDRGAYIAGNATEMVIVRSVSTRHAPGTITPVGLSHTAETCHRKRWLIKLDPSPLTSTQRPSIGHHTPRSSETVLLGPGDALTRAQSPDSSESIALPALLPISHFIEHVIGYRKVIVSPGHSHVQLIFLDRSLWVSSYDLPMSQIHKRRPSLTHRQNSERKPRSRSPHPARPSTLHSALPGKSGTTATRPFPTKRPSLSTTTSTHSPTPPDQPYYTRHLFIPDDWISSNYSNTHREASGQSNSMLFILAGPKQGELVFVRRGEVLVIKNAFLPGTGQRVEL